MIILSILGARPGLMNLLWGGFLSCLSEFAIVGSIWHGINCHEKGCWRPGHHVGGTVACHRHRGHQVPAAPPRPGVPPYSPDHSLIGYMEQRQKGGERT